MGLSRAEKPSTTGPSTVAVSNLAVLLCSSSRGGGNDDR